MTFCIIFCIFKKLNQNQSLRHAKKPVYPSTPITIISYFCINISPLKKVSQSIKFKFLTMDIKKLTLLKKTNEFY